MLMPVADREMLARRDECIAAFKKFLPKENVISDYASLAAYECDGLMAYRQRPLAVVLPETVEQVSKVMAYCHSIGLKIVPRGAGTSLSGGALPLEDGIVLAMGKFNRILEQDYENRCVVVQPCVTNASVTEAVADRGFYYAPDPSSQIVCSIGGNVAENAGGVHCLKYGMTSNNILGLEMVLIDGTVVRVGGKCLDSQAYDLLGLVCGSEGLLGVVTEVTVRILRAPETQRALLVGFADVESAGNCVAQVIGAGIIPAAMEIMDKTAIHAAESFVHVGYPLDVEALLLIELDGGGLEVDYFTALVSDIALQCGAVSTRQSSSEKERKNFWAGRKAAFPAVGKISPDYYCVDGTIPRNMLSRALAEIALMSRRFELKVANVFHAGDGNLHPMILYNADIEGEFQRAEDFGAAILTLCVDLGGVLTGEHGVGVEKRDLMELQFSPEDLNQQQRLKCAFDSDSLLNPGKVFPKLRRCAELGRVHVHRGETRFPDIERF